jgi:hypothetical protein
MKNKREYLLIPIFVVSGIALGVLAKAGDVAIQGNFFGNTLWAFGRVSSGFFIWVVICTWIAVLSKSKILASINVFLFLTAMIFAYYLYSHFIVDYLVWHIVKFWVAMLMPSMILGFIVWHIKTIHILKYIMIVLGTIIMLFDMLILQGAIPIAMIIDVILYVVFLASILSKRFNQI